MIEKAGIPTPKDLKKVLPSEERLERGACVIIECFERIPCNPCVDACPKSAIKIKGNINNLPQVDFEKCTGCGMCISACPGLAIFVVDKSYSSRTTNTNHDHGLVMLPYEFLPLPQKEDIVEGLSREGKKLCDAKVQRVLLTKKQDRTAIISILVPKDLVMEVRNIRVLK